jgi:hypothetical protein
MRQQDPVRLERTDGGPSETDLAAINHTIRGFGARVTPLDLGRESPEIKRLLAQPTLDPEENERVKSQLLISRQRLMTIIAEAGRAPRVPGGGALSTHVDPHGQDYPQLYVAEAGVDYSRFERFHENVAADGSGVDEILQVLSGAGFEYHRLMPDGTIITLRLGCPSPDHGWIVTYDGVRPHLATISAASPGTKVLVQVIGAPRWTMTYVDDAPACPDNLPAAPQRP